MLRLLVALMGPIFAKEMVEIARRRRYYFNRVLYCAALLVAMLIVWEDFGWRAMQYTAQRFMAELAEAMFIAVGAVQYGAVYLFVPVFLCGVISGERESHTLELLFTTHLTDREIVLGKLGSRVAVVALLLLCALPIMSLIMLFGGIQPAALWRTQAATLMGVVYAAAHAIYFSATGKSTVGALVRTYWWMALWLGGVPMAAGLIAVAVSPAGPPPLFVGTMFCINPCFQFIVSLSQEAYDFAVLPVGDWFYAASFVLPLAWSVLLTWRAVARLRLPPSAFAGKVPFIGALRQTLQEFREAADQRARRRAERTSFGRTVLNPLWLRARLARVYDREGHLRRIQWGGYLVAVAFIVLVLIADADELGDEEVAMSFLCVTWIAAAALTTIVASTSLVGDRRRGFLELVLATPLGAQDVVGGTMLAVWHHLRPVFWLVGCLGLFFAITGASPPGGILCSLITGALYCAVVVAMGTMCSLAATNAPQALVPTFLLSILTCVGLIIASVIVEEASGPLLWVGAPIFFLAARRWSRRSASAAAVGAYFIAVHVGLTTAATWWTYDGRHEEYPAAAMHPGYWAIAPLDGSIRYTSYRRITTSNGTVRMVPIRQRRDNPRWYDGPGRWYWALACYWTALLLNLWWARRWMIRHFDRLAGRTLRFPDAHTGDFQEGASPASGPV